MDDEENSIIEEAKRELEREREVLLSRSLVGVNNALENEINDTETQPNDSISDSEEDSDEDSDEKGYLVNKFTLYKTYVNGLDFNFVPLCINCIICIF